MKQFIDKPFQIIALAASLTFSKSTEAISQTFHWDKPKQSTTIVVNEETQQKIPSISHESKAIKSAWGHPKTLSKAILLAIEDLKLKGNMDINEKFTTEHIHEITATFEKFIIENFSKFATKLPDYSVKITNSIYKIITVDYKDGKNTISITITISWTKVKPLITISAKWKKTITNEYGIASTELKENTVTTLPNKHSSQSKGSEWVWTENKISNTQWSNWWSEVNTSIVSNPITINEKWFANITNKGIGRSLEACLLQEADISEKNAEVLGSRIWSKINTRLNTHIFANWWSLQIVNSKVKVALGGKNELEVTVICAEPIQWKKWIQYSKTLISSIFNIMYGPNNEIIVFNKSN